MSVKTVAGRSVVDCGSFVIPIGSNTADLEVPGLGILTIEVAQVDAHASVLTAKPDGSGAHLAMRHVTEAGVYFDGSTETMKFALTVYRIHLPQGDGFTVTYSIVQ